MSKELLTMTSSHSSPEEPEPSFASQADIDSFVRYLNSSRRILVLCGAGLSAPSGIPTFKGSGSLWRNHKAASLSSIEAFEANPGLVWSYFADRRRLALKCKPNKAHEALAKVAEVKNRKRKGVKVGDGMVVLTQNIDGLSQRAKHPKELLYELHGSLMDIKCSNPICDYIDRNNTMEPICPALVEDAETLSSFSSKPQRPLVSVDGQVSSPPLTKEQTNQKYERPPNPLEAILESLAPTITPEMKREVIPVSQLPHCPKCTSLLRPAVVWFGESLSQTQFDEINAWIDLDKKLDLMMVIGTQAEVFPAARFVQTAKEKGARIAVVNLDENHTGGMTLRGKDWLFAGDVEEILDVLFEGVLLNN